MWAQTLEKPKENRSPRLSPTSLARCYRTHLTGGYTATGLADPPPKSFATLTTSHTRWTLYEIQNFTQILLYDTVNRTSCFF